MLRAQAVVGQAAVGQAAVGQVGAGCVGGWLRRWLAASGRLVDVVRLVSGRRAVLDGDTWECFRQSAGLWLTQRGTKMLRRSKMIHP